MSRKTALITGASAGIGLKFAELLAAKGFNLILVARRKERLDELGLTLQKKFSIQCHSVVADLSDLSAADRVFSEIQEKKLHVDFLVNNAGYSLKKKFSRNSWEETEKFLNLMITMVTKLTHLFLPSMKERNYGRIINVSSVAAYVPEDSGSLYTAAKKYVLSFSKAVDKEFAGSNINCLALCPGFTHTEFHEVLGNKKSVESFPSFMWMDAETVVRQGYEAVMGGQRVLINGWANKVICFICRLIPDSVFVLLTPKKVLETSYKAN